MYSITCLFIYEESQWNTESDAKYTTKIDDIKVSSIKPNKYCIIGRNTKEQRMSEVKII